MKRFSRPIASIRFFLLAILFFQAPVFSQEKTDPPTKDKKPGLSLEATRKVAFTTNEGTYMNLDVSPDGEAIVFDLLGDIYTLPIEGGVATRLTQGMSYDVQPVFSPDGSRIAFVSDKSGSDNIWAMDADGSHLKALTTEKEKTLSTPDWSPDGDYLLARRSGDLWLYHRQGGAGLKLTDDRLAGGLTGPIFAPEGRYVFFSSRGGGGGSGGGGLSRFTAWQIRRLDRLTGDVATITASPNGAFRPALSPDGKWLAYGARLDARTGLRIRDLESDRERWLLFAIDRDNAERAGMLDTMPRFAFTPDSRSLVIATGGTFQRVSVADGTAEKIHFTAQVEQDLGPLVYFEGRHSDDPVEIRNLRYCNRDPKGERLVFSALNKIWAMELPDGTPAPLIDQPFGQFQPVFSPDGTALAYVSWDDVEGGHVWRVPLNGLEAGEPVRLTEHPGYYLHPAWSPAGGKIAFLKEDAATFRNIWSRNTGRIVWLESSGGVLHEVTSAPSDNRLTFSPDGERLSYIAEITPGNRRENKPGTSELVSVRLDGTDKRVLARIQAESSEAVPSPDGKWVAFGVREDIYVAALPLSSEPPTIGEKRGPGPVKRITREGGVDLHWEDEGKTLAWSFSNNFHYLSLEEIFQEVEEPSEAEAEESEEAPAEKKPDQPRAHSIAVDLSRPRHRPEGVVALVGATLIPMNSENVISDSVVVVSANRIVMAASGSDVEIPNGARVIDIKGKYILPGMIDMHAHLRPPREVFVETSWSYLANLAYGVTSTRDVSTSNDSFAYAELVESGEMIGPRIYSTGRAMTTSNAKIESLDDARAMVRHYKKLGTHVVKQYMQPHRRQRQWVIQACKEEQMNVTNEGGGDLRLNMTQILDGYTGIEHSLPVADIYNDVVQLFAQSGTWYTPTLVVSYGGPTAEWYFYQTTEVHDDAKLASLTPHDDLDRRTRRGQKNALDEYHFIAVSKGAAKILQEGGKVALGAHGEQQGICAHWELWALQMGGLSNYDALRTATMLAAEGLGLQQDLGTIEAGKLADLIVLDKNPLEDIRNSNTIVYVMKNGELFDGITLDSIWPEQRPRPPLGYRVIDAPPEQK